MRYKLLLLPAALLAVGIARLLAADPIEERFHQFDTNHDGVLSGDELKGADFLPKLDLNGDGKVTLEEAREAMAKLRGGIVNKIKSAVSGGGSEETLLTEAVFNRLDKNGDGKLTREELPNATWFDRLDLDKDGFVTLEEARKVIGARIPKKALGHDAGGDQAAVTANAADSLKQQPERLKATEAGVGRQVPDLALTKADGGMLQLGSLKERKAVVLALFSATCPISGKLAPELARLEKEYSKEQVAFLLIDTSSSDAKEFITSHALSSPVINDGGKALQLALAATTTTEVFVLDSARTLVYRGAINDQYGLGYSKEAPTKHYLREALDSTLLGEMPIIGATSAPGCALDLAPAANLAASKSLTYHKDISRIVQANCADCHHKDGIGPFSLSSYENVIEHAGMIKKQVDRGAMPPWFAAQQEGRAHEWANDRSLSPKDKADLLAWLNSDRPLGNPADAPLPRHFDEQWSIGQPDAVFQLPRPVVVKAEGVMPYQIQTVETSFAEDRWVSAYEIMPTARTVVHHVIVHVHPKGSKIKEREEGRDGFFAAYVPGNGHRILPDGFAKKLPAGSRLSFQIHYTPNGKQAEDQLKIGLRFAKQAPQYEVHVASLSNPRLNIPAGEANHIETASQVISGNMMLTAFVAHMHVRGKAFKYELISADGKAETLLDIPRYDFNWQLQYDLAQPRFIPAGSTMKITAIYDNSSGNPANPDPKKNVRWGPQTYDEMMIGYVEHFTPVPSAKVAAK
jgi:peroxiredoxin